MVDSRLMRLVHVPSYYMLLMSTVTALQGRTDDLKTTTDSENGHVANYYFFNLFLFLFSENGSPRYLRRTVNINFQTNIFFKMRFCQKSITILIQRNFRIIKTYTTFVV